MFQKCTQSTSQLHSLRNVFQNGFHCYKIRIFAFLLSTGLFKKRRRGRERGRGIIFVVVVTTYFLPPPLLLISLPHFVHSEAVEITGKDKKPIIARLSSVFMRHINHFVIHFKERTAEEWVCYSHIMKTKIK